MPSAGLRPPVPSRSLLRFLRSQTEVSCFSNAHSSLASTKPLPRRRTQSPTCFAGRRDSRALSTCSRLRRTGATKLQTPVIDSQQLRLGRLEIRNGLRTNKAAFGTTAALLQPINADTTKPAPTWQERLWGISARKGAKPLKPDDLPSHDELDHSSSMFNNRRILTAKASLEPRLRCTEVDETGNVILVDGEFKKSELIAKV